MPDPPDLFEQAARLADDPAALLRQFAQSCERQRDWTRLFEARLMQARWRLGLPIDCTLLSDQSSEARSELEAAYRDACLEAGEGLIADLRLLDAWPYFKAAGDQQPMADALRATTPNEEDHEALIQLALHEGANPPVGYRWLLEWFGTCNAVTALDGLAGYLAPDELRACAETLVDWLHRELSDNVAAHIERQEGARPSGSLAEMLAGRTWLFEHESSHVDASHLGATVRWARQAVEPELLRKALDLAEYGARLHESQRYPQPPPFEETYAAHQLWLRAMAGEGQDEAAAYFRRQIDQHPDEYSRPACLEEYVVLLGGIGRGSQALRELAELVAVDEPLPAGVPTPLELARKSGDWEAYDRLVKLRRDAVGYAAGLIARREAG